MATTIVKTTYIIRTADAQDNVLQFDITVRKDAQAIPNISELDMMAFIRNSLQGVTADPVTLSRIQTIQTDELGV